MRAILNLTQHPATPEQKLEGVVDFPPEIQERIRRLLTFDTMPDDLTVWNRAQALAVYAMHFMKKQERPSYRVLIGGAPYLMWPLVQGLHGRGLTPTFAFSRRESEEHPQVDGTVVKTSVFKHIGFVDQPID